jgi:chromate transporter
MKDIQLSERLKEVALLFLRLGATSFGGPAAYIGLMHHEIVVRRKWSMIRNSWTLWEQLTSFRDQCHRGTAHLGLIRAGWLGLILAGALFIIPGTAAIIVVAWAYVKYGSCLRLLGYCMGLSGCNCHYAWQSGHWLGQP